MPTPLGNLLRAAEEYPYLHYGLITSICWPRLWLLLPPETQTAVSSARQRLERAAQLALWGLLFLVWTAWAWWAALIALGDREEAQPLLLAAIENAQATGERFLLWRLDASLGELYCALGRQPEAEREFSKARELIQELADTVPDGALRDQFFRRAHERLRTWS